MAGPGTGKTMTLTHRIAHVIREGAAPDQILALTFTRKAAQEMEQRISRLLGDLNPGKVRVSTFHGFCLEILRRHGDRAGLPADFILCAESDADNLAKDFLNESGAGKRLIRKFIKTLPDIKTASVLGPPDEPFDRELVSLFEKYQRRLRDLGMLDLDDLEIEALRLFRDHSDIAQIYAETFPWIFVDEYQDTNPVQVELLKAIVHAGSATLCAIGDPDQAIYGFRGADIRNFHRFCDDFPGTTEITLIRNYRSTKFILKGAAALMGHVKPLQCESSEGSLICLASCRTDGEEAEMIVEQVERLMGGTSSFSMDSGRVASHEGEIVACPWPISASFTDSMSRVIPWKRPWTGREFRLSGPEKPRSSADIPSIFYGGYSRPFSIRTTLITQTCMRPLSKTTEKPIKFQRQTFRALIPFWS